MSGRSTTRRRGLGPANDEAGPSAGHGAEATPAQHAQPQTSTTQQLTCPVPQCNVRHTIKVYSNLTNHCTHIRSHETRWEKDDPRLAHLLPIVPRNTTATEAQQGLKVAHQCTICHQPYVFTDKKTRNNHAWSCARPFKWSLTDKNMLNEDEVRAMANTWAPDTIPATLRADVGRVISHLMYLANQNTGHRRPRWLLLLVAFHGWCLRKSGAKANDSTMNNRIQMFIDGQWENLRADHKRATDQRAAYGKKKKTASHTSHKKHNAFRSIQLMKEGSVTKASNTISSTMRVADLSNEANIKEKYEEHMGKKADNEPDPPSDQCPQVELKEADILLTTSKLNGRKSSGAFGISPSALKCMMHPDVHPPGLLETLEFEDSPKLSANILTTFLNNLIDGTVNRESFIVQEVFLASRGIPLYDSKKNKLRPIGIPCPWLNVCSSTIARIYKQKFIEVLGDQQLCLQRNGVDKIIHTKRARYEKDMEDPTAAHEAAVTDAKGDISKAFDGALRPNVTKLVYDAVPEIAKYAYLLYCRPTTVYTQGEVYSQEVGVLQGEPLSPFFFSITTVEALKAAKDAMKQVPNTTEYAHHEHPIAHGFADDSTFVGTHAQIVAGITAYATHMHKQGFKMETKVTKNVAWPLSPAIRADHQQNGTTTIPIQYGTSEEDTFDLHIDTQSTGTITLGSPVGDDNHVQTTMEAHQQHWARRLDDMLALADIPKRLTKAYAVTGASSSFEPGVQCALYMARTCEIPRLMFYMRTVPASQWRTSLEAAATAMQNFLLRLTKRSDNMTVHDMSPYARIMMSQPLRSNGFGLTDPLGIADIALGNSIVHSLDFMATHQPIRDIQDHWRALPSIQVRRNDDVDPPVTIKALDHTEAECTPNYRDSLSRLWDMVPIYMSPSYSDMAKLAESDSFPPTLLTKLNKTQNLMSRGRHNVMLTSLEQELKVSVPGGANAATLIQRHQHLQLTHIAKAAACGPTPHTTSSITAAMLTVLPLYPALERDCRTLRLFTIDWLRLWPAPPDPYTATCPLCNVRMFNPVIHALSCQGCSGKRTHRHDAAAKIIHEDIIPLTCNAAHLEPPPGNNPDNNERPDIQFQNADPNNPSTSVGTNVEGYTCSDITFTTIRVQQAVTAVAPPEADSVWARPRNQKYDKHSVDGHVCLPMVFSVFGAFDPKAMDWMRKAIASSPFPIAKQRFRFSTYHSKLSYIIWKHNLYIYNHYYRRMQSANSSLAATLPCL